MEKNRKFLILILFLATVTIGITAVYIGYRLRQQPDVSPEEIEAAITCVQGFSDDFNTDDGTPNIANWGVFPDEGTLVEVDSGRLVMTHPIRDDGQATLASIQTLEMVDGDFSVEVDVVNFDANSADSNMALSFPGPDSYYFSINLSLDEGSNELVISGDITGGDNNQVRVANIVPEVPFPMLKFRIDRTVNTAAGTADIVIYYDHAGSGYTELVKSEVSGLFIESGSFSLSSLVPLDANSGLDGQFDNFAISCPSVVVDTPVPEPTLAEGTCSCELGVVTSENCVVPNVPACTGQTSCECTVPSPTPELVTTIADDPLATPTPTPTIEATPENVEPTATLEPTPELNTVTVVEESVTACSKDGTQATVNYEVNLTNTLSQARTVNVTVALDDLIQDSTVQMSSITFGGVYSNGSIVWTDLSLPESGVVTLNYQVIIPSASYENYTDQVMVLEVDQEVGNTTYTINIDCLPGTAIISDKADRLILAMLLILSGFLFLKAGIYMDAGNLFWKAIGKKVFPAFTTGFDEVLKNEFEKEVEKSYKKVK